MRGLDELFDGNRAWAKRVESEDPGFFEKLAKQQSPGYLWVGCSDSRVPANQIVDLMPGQIFVHRNVGNVAAHTDLNCLSVIHYAVGVLQVKNIIVCGHYGCGAIRAALENRELGLIDNWLRHIQDVMHKHSGQLARIPTERERWDRLAELNVIEQLMNVSRTTIVRQAWAQGHALSLHGLIYSLSDGLLRDLKISGASEEELAASYAEATALNP